MNLDIPAERFAVPQYEVGWLVGVEFNAPLDTV